MEIVTILTTNMPRDKLATAMSRLGRKDDDAQLHLRVGLRKAHRNLCIVKWDVFSKQQPQLDELAEALAEENESTK